MAHSHTPRITSDTRLVAIGDQITSDMGDECVILSLTDGIYYGMEGVGNRIWSLLGEPRTLAELCEAIIHEYDVTAERCQEAVTSLLEELMNRNLVRIEG
jgi:hypothetical protein